jgi:hypothetical protein
MTTTINEMQAGVRSMEADARKAVEMGGDIGRAGVNIGFMVASIVAKQTILELGIKGALPEGRSGAIMAEINTAIEASKERVLGKQA